MLYMPPRSIPDPWSIQVGLWFAEDLFGGHCVVLDQCRMGSGDQGLSHLTKGRMLLLREFLGRMDSVILCTVMSSRMMFNYSNYRFRPSGWGCSVCCSIDAPGSGVTFFSLARDAAQNSHITHITAIMFDWSFDTYFQSIFQVINSLNSRSFQDILHELQHAVLYPSTSIWLTFLPQALHHSAAPFGRTIGRCRKLLIWCIWPCPPQALQVFSFVLVQILALLAGVDICKGRVFDGFWPWAWDVLCTGQPICSML